MMGMVALGCMANACSDKMHQLVAKGERIGRGKGLEY
jgi:hypothetical protein